jgi:hypothetical protein
MEARKLRPSKEISKNKSCNLPYPNCENVIRVKHLTVDIHPESAQKSADNEEIMLSEICQRIRNLPELVVAEIMKYQRKAESNSPIRKKINGEFRTAIAIQSLVLGNEQSIPLLHSFILFMKHYYSSEYYGPRTQISMTENCIDIMEWMYSYVLNSLRSNEHKVFNTACIKYPYLNTH